MDQNLGPQTQKAEMLSFRDYFKEILRKIQFGDFKPIECIKTESVLFYTFIITHVCYITSDYLRAYQQAFASSVTDEGDLTLSEAANTLDEFFTFLKIEMNEDILNEVSYLLYSFLIGETKESEKINYKWILSQIMDDESTTNYEFLRLKQTLCQNNSPLAKIFQTGSLNSLAASLKSKKNLSWDVETYLNDLKLCQWEKNETSVIEIINILLTTKIVIEKKKFQRINTSYLGPKQRAVKRKISPERNCTLTETDKEILHLCHELCHANPIRYQWLTNEENIKNKSFIKNSTSDRPDYELLEKLNFGKKSSLKKNVKRARQFINVLNNLFASDEFQRGLRLSDVDDLSQLKKQKMDSSLSESEKSEKSETKDIKIINIRRPLTNYKQVSCYANAAIQFLFNLKKFSENLISSTETDNEWLKVMKSIMKKINTNDNGPANIDDEFKKIYLFSGMSGFRVTNRYTKATRPVQGDIVEFIQILLEKLPERLGDLFNMSSYLTMSTITTVNVEEFENFERTLNEISDDTLPEYLLVMCNRVDVNLKKSLKSVRFSEYITVTGQKYRLNGVIRHTGELASSGHYIAYTRCDETNDFIEYDDKVMTRMSFDTILNLCDREFCMLSYEKIDEIQVPTKVDENDCEDVKITYSNESLNKMKPSTKIRDIYKILDDNDRNKGPEKCISKIQKAYNRNFCQHGIEVMTRKFKSLKRKIERTKEGLHKKKRYLSNILQQHGIENDNEEFYFSQDLFELPETDHFDNEEIQTAEITNPPIFETTKRGRGRPKQPYMAKGERARRDVEKELAEKMECFKAGLKSLLRIARQTKQSAHIEVFKRLIEFDQTNTVEKMVELLKQPIIEKVSPSLAYLYMLREGMSIRGYNRFRRLVNSTKAVIFPSYKQMDKFKQEKMPNTLKFSDTEASIALEELNLLTINSLIFLIDLDDWDRIFARYKIGENEKLKGIIRYIWGLDGTTQQSNYHQKGKKGEKIDDSSLMIASLAPVEVTIYRENGTKLYTWRNPSPGSRLFNRTIIMRYEKETDASIKKMYDEVNDQIEMLKGKIVERVATIRGRNVDIIPEFHFTMIDGKVVKVLTNTPSCQQCPVCGAKPNDMNYIANLKNGKFQMKQKPINHSVSPLHSVINFCRALYNISCRKGIETWRVTGNDKTKFKTNRLRIKQALWDNFGVRFDEPTKGGLGSTTTGGVCRRLLKEPKKLARVLELDEKLVERIAIILKALNCKEDIDGDKFGKYALETYKLFVQKYDWYKMPMTMHKVLAHGGEIIKQSPLPVGMMTEEGQEAKNKLFRHYREFLARKVDRTKTNKDVFVRMLFVSDPFHAVTINAESTYKVKKDNLPQEIKNLLLNTENIQLDQNEDEIDEELYHESEDILEILEEYEEQDRNFDEDGEYEEMVNAMHLYNENIDYTIKPRYAEEQ